MNSITIQSLGKIDREFIERLNPGYSLTDETLTEKFADGSAHTMYIFRGPFTQSGMCRDCGDHYIIARYSRYDRIDKGTFAITYDVEDY